MSNVGRLMGTNSTVSRKEETEIKQNVEEGVV